MIGVNWKNFPVKVFFTSWKWVGCWLKIIDYRANLISVYDQDVLVGLAFFTLHEDKRFGYSTQQLWMNRTGERALDQIWSEYNDIICPRGREWAIRSAVISHLIKIYPKVDEFILGVSREEISETPIPDSLFPRTIWETESYATQLLPQYADLNTYLSSLSKNTRHQIRRTLKLLQSRGDVHLKRARTLDEALSMLDNAGKLHKERWPGIKSGFNNPVFTYFHEELIKRNFDSRCIDILCLEVNGEPMSYLYNFVYHGYVYFYLSGIQYEDDNRIKPGLLTHALAISMYASEGCSMYDFMGGRGQYKSSLCSHKENLLITSFQRKRPLLLFKRWVNETKSRFKPTGTLLSERE